MSVEFTWTYLQSCCTGDHTSTIFFKKTPTSTTQPTTGNRYSFGVLGYLRVIGYTNLNCPKIPSCRRLADESPSQVTTMDNLPHACYHLRNASNQWIPTICQILTQTRITSQLCHKLAFSDGTYLNHQDYMTIFFITLQNDKKFSAQ